MAAITSAVVVAGAAAYGAMEQNKAGKRQERAMKTQEDAAIRQAELAEQQQQIANEQWANYRDTYMPLEQSFVQESKGLGSLANREQAAAEARADVAGAYSQARSQLNRTPSANPASQAYINAANKINLEEAANSAAAQTGARRTVAEKGRAAIVDAISLGKGLPASASSGLANAASALGASSSTANSLYGNAGQSAQGASNAIGGFANAVGGLANNSAIQNWWNGSNAGHASNLSYANNVSSMGGDGMGAFISSSGW